MERALVAFLTLILLSSFLSAASAKAPDQTYYQPVSQCSQGCTPADVYSNTTLPLTGKDSVITILYAHHYKPLPLTALVNLQPVNRTELSGNEGPNFITLNTETGTDANLHFRNSLITWASTAGTVTCAAGACRVHDDPGLAETATIVGDTIWLYFYLAVNHVPGGNDGSSPGSRVPLDAMPAVGVYARIESGRHSMSSQSVVYAEGDTGAKDFSGLAPTGDRAYLVSREPGQPQIYEFRVPLTVASEEWFERGDTVDGKQVAGYLVTINVYQLKSKSDTLRGSEVTWWDWRYVWGADFPPRMLVEVANPMRSISHSLNLMDGKLFLRWAFESPWGSYDPDEKTLHIAFDGPTEISPDVILPPVTRRSIEYLGHFDPVNGTFRVEYLRAGLADGEYTATMSVQNLQGTYRLQQRVLIRVVNSVPESYMDGGEWVPIKAIGGGGTSGQSQKESGGLPGFEAVLVVFGLLAAYVASRRRHP